ncbi:MAG TPA: DUF5056 domain-containing protein [Chthoniobacterales bacterium]|nr:DUF5056 domain-containing protein [Chthoniobacterales bacterium]
MKNNFIDDQELDRQLREAAPYIDDAGFTARVMQSLPAQSARAMERLRGTVLIVAALLASVLAYFLSGGGRFVYELVARLSALPPVWLFGLAGVAGIIVGALGLAAAVFTAREPAMITR